MQKRSVFRGAAGGEKKKKNSGLGDFYENIDVTATEPTRSGAIDTDGLITF